MSETTAAQKSPAELANSIMDLLENQQASAGLQAVLMVADCILDQVLKDAPPPPVADTFRELQDHIVAHIQAFSRPNEKLTRMDP